MFNGVRQFFPLSSGVSLTASEFHVHFLEEKCGLKWLKKYGFLFVISCVLYARKMCHLECNVVFMMFCVLYCVM